MEQDRGTDLLSRRAFIVRAIVTLAIVVLVASWLGAGIASAHAFEVEHTPAQGARLRERPEAVALRFTEPVIAGSVDISVRDISGQPIASGAPVLLSGDREVRLPLLADHEGVYLTSWSVIAASDGHVTAGEFAFAVGDAAATIPAASENTDTVTGLAVASGWLLLAGLSLTGGALIVQAFLPLTRENAGVVGMAEKIGIAAAIVGAAAQLPGLGLFSAGRDEVPLWWSVPGIATLAAVAVLAVALAVVHGSADRRWALVLVMLAGALWSARSHAAAYGGVWLGVVDFVHLSAAAAWAGTLAVVAMLLWRSRHGGRRAVLAVLKPYSRLALWLVAVVLISGLVSAVGLVGTLSALISGHYGLVLIGKVALVVLAVALAGWARFRALPQRRLAALRRLTTGELGILAAVFVATASLSNMGPPIGQAAAAELLGPAPMPEPIARAAGLAGNLTVALTAGDGRLRVEVLAPSGPVEKAEAMITAEFPDGTDATLHPRPCGEACWEQELVLPQGATRITVHAGAPEWRGGTFIGELAWPPAPERLQLLPSVIHRMRAVPNLQLEEMVTSDSSATGPVTTTDLTGEEFIALEPYAAGDVVDVRSVGDGVIEFALPASRMLFTLWLDDDGRIREERIINPGHEIRRTFTYNGQSG